MNNYRYEEFLKACRSEGIAPYIWAQKNGFGNSLPSYLKNGSRPNVETLKKLATAWSDKTNGLNIIAAHLKDEVEAAGLSVDAIKISTDPNASNSSSALDDDLNTVQQFMKHRPIRESIHALAALLKVSEWSKQDEPSNLIAEAEELALMQRARRKKKSTKNAS